MVAGNGANPPIVQPNNNIEICTDSYHVGMMLAVGAEGTLLKVDCIGCNGD